MQLRAVYFVMKYTVPPALFVNADHTGILYLQVKGSGWFAESGRKVQPEMQGFGLKNLINSHVL